MDQSKDKPKRWGAEFTGEREFYHERRRTGKARRKTKNLVSIKEEEDYSESGQSEIESVDASTIQSHSKRKGSAERLEQSSQSRSPDPSRPTTAMRETPKPSKKTAAKNKVRVSALTKSLLT